MFCEVQNLGDSVGLQQQQLGSADTVCLNFTILTLAEQHS